MSYKVALFTIRNVSLPRKIETLFDFIKQSIYLVMSSCNCTNCCVVIHLSLLYSIV